MALQKVCLLILLVSEVITLNCDWIVQNQEQENRRNMDLLKAMGTQVLPLECVAEMPNFDFPMKKLLGSSSKDGRAAMVVILEQASKIYQHNFTQAGWNARVATQLREALFQQSVEWKRCQIAATGEAPSFNNLRVKLSLLAYFQKIQTHLKKKNYSFCVWEVVRQEMWKSFFVGLDQFLKTLRD